jgi:uncharacterized DUF497 family protein
MTVIDGGFEWDAEKAETNILKHGVSFDEAQTVFGDDNLVIVDDGSGTARLWAIGFSAEARMLTVVHVELEDADRIRIISARLATKGERRIYQEG